MADKEWAKRRVKAKRDEVTANAKKPDVVAIIRKEAKAAGATLAHGGRGGLDPKLALEVFRRDNWTCQVEDCPDPKHMIDLDHIAGHAKEIEEDPKARNNEALKKGVELGHINDPDALHVICVMHHDQAHSREEAIEDGKKPKPMTRA